MKEVTVSLLRECISGRRKAKNCTRCGGSGLFRTIQKYDELASGFGQECFYCSKHRKLPLRWIKSTNYDKAGFISSDMLTMECVDLNAAKMLLNDLVETDLITLDDSKEIFVIIEVSIKIKNGTVNCSH